MDRCRALAGQIHRGMNSFKLKEINKRDRVRILAYVRLVVLLTAFGFSIWLLGAAWIRFHFTEVEVELAKLKATALLLKCVVTGLVFVLETGLLFILFKAVKQQSLKKCSVWYMINLANFTVAVVSFIYELIAGAGKTSEFITLLDLIFGLLSLKIVHDYMGELRNPPTEFQPMANENV